MTFYENTQIARYIITEIMAVKMNDSQKLRRSFLSRSGNKGKMFIVVCVLMIKNLSPQNATVSVLLRYGLATSNGTTYVAGGSHVVCG